MHKYFLATNNFPKEYECIVLRDGEETSRERFDYELGCWVRDVDTWWRHCGNSNDYEDLTEDEAREIVERFGGNFDAN